MSAAACFPISSRPAAAGGSEVTVYRTPTSLAAMSSEWASLYQRAGGLNPFVSSEWVQACFESVAAGSEAFVVALRREGVLTGIAPLRLERQFGFRVLRPAGSGWSPYAGFLVGEDHPKAEFELLSALAELRREWDLLLITQLAEPVSRLHLSSSLPSGVRGVIEPTPWTGSAFLARDVQWETLLAEGPGWLKRMAKAQRKFERDGGSIQRLVGAEAAARRREIEAVESVAWQGRLGQTGDAAKRKAVMSLLERALANCPEAELWLAYKDDQPVAYEVNLRTAGRLWMYRGAYHPDYARWSPSGVVDFVSIREAWQSGYREYDLMSGGEAYKLGCTDSIRDLKQLTLVPMTVRGSLAYAALRAPKRFAESHPAGRRLVRFAARALRSPRAFLPGSGAAARRAH